MSETASAPAPRPFILCGPPSDCADPNVNRWYCMRGHDGAPPGVCPLKHCERKGANRK